MNVTIIGAGNMGRGIGHRLVAGGHGVMVVDGDPEEVGRLAEELRGVAQLVRDGDLRAIDVGPLERARQLEGLGFLQPLGLNFQSAWKLIS